MLGQLSFLRPARLSRKTRNAAAAAAIARPAITGRTYLTTPKLCTGVSCATGREFVSAVADGDAEDDGSVAADDPDGEDDGSDEAEPGGSDDDAVGDGLPFGSACLAGLSGGTAPFWAAMADDAATAYAPSAPSRFAAVSGR
jgi:hypothetical protein